MAIRGGRATWGRLGVGLGLLAAVTAPVSSCAADFTVGQPVLYFESPGFTIRVADQETGQPLSGVHALAQWVRYSRGGGAVMVARDAVSGPDGLLVFPPWGPVRGYYIGLKPGQDPVITLFRPGYLLPRWQGEGRREIHNITPQGTTETTRVRRFREDGATFAMEPFRGGTEEWLNHLREAAFPGSGGVSDEERINVGEAALNRLERVRAELNRLPRDRRDVRLLDAALDRELQFWRREWP
jgi:hypothetical protein